MDTPTPVAVPVPRVSSPAPKLQPGEVRKPKVAPIPDPHVGRRHDHWQTLMHRHIKEKREKPFVWGQHDCCTWVADHIKAVTGVDLYQEFRGQYTDAKGAFLAIRRIAGGATVEDAADYCFRKYGVLELKHPGWATRGDIVLYDQRDGDGNNEPILGVVNLDGQVGLFVTDHGFLRYPVAKCRRAWRVGGVHPHRKELKHG